MKRIWNEIRNDYEEDGIFYIDAWQTEDDDEEGKVIAKVNFSTGDVLYVDHRARTDEYAQEMIKDVLMSTMGSFDKNGDVNF